MAETKLSWSELRHVLALRAGVSEKSAGAFLVAFQEQLVEGLKRDKQVKVNGLGTFKLQAVAPRKSVNVQTGEEITIEGYNKLVFVPEAGVKELVEKGPSELGVTAKTLGLNESAADPLKKLSEQAREIVDILGELGQSPNSGQETKEEEPVVEEEPEVEEVHEEPVVKEKPKEPEKPQKKYHFVRDTLICVVILLMLLLAGYFFLRSQLSQWIESLGQPKQETTEVVEPQPVVAEPVIETEEPEAIQVAEEAEEPEAPVEEEAMTDEDEWRYTEFITTEEITPGSRLAWISKKHYGDKIYWPYLYDANRDRIVNPSRIAVGTPIRVPRLTAVQRDTTLERTRVHLEQLRKEAEEASRAN